MDYYDEQYAFFPNQLNSNSRQYYYFYLTGRLQSDVSAHAQVVGNADTVPKSHYSIEGPFGQPMRVRRIDAPGVSYSGRIFKFHRK